MAERLPDDIHELVDLVREANESPENVRRQSLWEHWGPTTDRGSSDGLAFPITIEPEAPLWADILEFSLVAFYQDPAEYLRRNLQMMLYRLEHWREDTPVEKRIRVWMGVSLEASLFGATTHYGEGNCPWLGPPIAASPEALLDLPRPDFRTSGLMPHAHRMYGEIRELLPDDFDVDFPDWERSPFGVCVHLRGTEDMLVDLIQDPDLARDQVQFVADCRMQFATDRAEFLGRPVEPGVLLNDEVNGDLFPPALYEQLILPAEKQLGGFQGIRYWHSCGKVTDFVELVHEIPGLEVFHVSPRTEEAPAAEAMADKALQVCLDPVADVQRASDEHITGRIGQIISDCSPTPFTIRADGLHTIDTLERELGAIDHWLELALAAREEAGS